MMQLLKMLPHWNRSPAWQEHFGFASLSLLSPSSTSTFHPGCEKSEGCRMDEGQYLFYFAAVFSPSFFFFFFRNAPVGSCCESPSNRQTTVSPSFHWERKRRALALLERLDSVLPDWPTNEEPASFYGPAVLHIISADNYPSLSAPPEKSIGFLGLRDMKTLHYRAPAPLVYFLCLSVLRFIS